MNKKFLERWPSGKGEGWVAEKVHPNWEWYITKVTTHNTSYYDGGSCECWPQWGGKLDRRFWNVDQVFRTEAGAIDYINSNIKREMDNLTKSMDKLQEMYDQLKSKLIL